jgi:hypothetical protein
LTFRVNLVQSAAQNWKVIHKHASCIAAISIDTVFIHGIEKLKESKESYIDQPQCCR